MGNLAQDRYIYIILSMSGTRFSKFLKFFSHLTYTHVSLSLTPDITTMYSFARQNLKMPWIAGFVEEHPNTGIFGIYNPSCEVLKVKVSNTAYNQIKKYIESTKLRSKEYNYNFPGLLFTYLKIPQKLRKSFTCTQFIAWVLTQAKISFNKDPSLVIPSDYYSLPNSEIIFSGNLHNYPYSLYIPQIG